EHQELLAAGAAEQVEVAQVAAEGRGDALEYLVADQVAVAVVDRLEVVHVEHQGGEGRARLVRPGDGGGGALLDAAPVVHAGERVGRGGLVQPRHARP